MQNNNFTMQLPQDAKEIICLLENAGYPSYTVGGCCRDAMLGQAPHDYDICTAATPEQMKSVLEKAGYNTYDTGIQHGTISVLGNDREIYEVTVFRIDGEYTDGRHPDSVQFVSDITLDLSRRDFTINAMAYSPDRGLADPFGGAEDLEKGLIRCVGDPNKRFQEDGLRIMRAIRFAATYGFEIEPKTRRAIHDNKHLLQNVSAERKTVEFIKTITHANADLLMEYGDVFAEFIPEIKPMFEFDQKSPWHMYDVWEHTAKTVEAAPHDPTIRIAAFFHDIGKPQTFQYQDGVGHFHNHASASKDITEAVMRRMRFDNQSIKDVTELIANHSIKIIATKPYVKAILYKMGIENTQRLIALTLADSVSHRESWEIMQGANHNELSPESIEIYNRILRVKSAERIIEQVIDGKEPYQIKDLAINGYDLIEMGITGKDIGDTLNHVLLDVIQHPEWNNKDILLESAELYRSANSVVETMRFDELVHDSDGRER